MKDMKKNLRRLLPVFLVLFLLLALFGGWSLIRSGRRWFSFAGNTYARQQKKNAVAGAVYDTNGILLAYTSDSQRVYAEDEGIRRAMVHVVGDAQGNVANAVESFMAYYLYGFDMDFLDQARLFFAGSPKAGDTISLTVDAALSGRIASWFPSDKRGAVCVMNYRTGEVIALLSFPNYDPMGNLAAVRQNAGQPFYNRATQGLYAPGSTFKIVTMSAMLDAFADAAQRTYICTGDLALSGAVITDAGTDLERQVYVRHGDITLERAFRVSCNNTFAQAALDLGDARLKRMAERFGFNVNFLFRDLVVENAAYPSENRTDREVAMTGIGQSALAVTPMHMCLIASAVANDGIMMEPRLLKNVTNFHGQTLLDFSSQVSGTVLPKASADVIGNLMRDVVMNGTGTAAAISGVRVCGKTGSAEIDGQENTNAWFVGFLDEENCPYALSVLVEDGGGGGAVAAPIARKIFQYLLNLNP